MKVYTVQSTSLGESYIIGVADSLEKAKKIYADYHEMFEVNSESDDERVLNIVYTAEIWCKGDGYPTHISIEEYTLNEAYQ